MNSRDLHWSIGGQSIPCRIEEANGRGVFHIAGEALPFHVLDSSHVEISGKRRRFYVVHRSDGVTVWLDGRTYQLKRATKAGEAETVQGTGEIRALMPGKLLRVNVAVGDVVEEKQTVAVMESMKMESALTASRSGRVSEVRVKPGDVVDMGETVMIIEAPTRSRERSS
jgi:acetyl/propionyl-CoA carboxylase alpha subunit